MNKKIGFFALMLIFAVTILPFVYANSYIIDTYFTIPDSVFMTNENIALKGYLFLTNYTANGTLVNSSYAFPNANINFTIRNSNGSQYSNYSFTTDSAGAFYSSSNYYVNATNVSSPAVAGTYSLKAQYIDANNSIWFSEVGIEVVNKTIDSLGIRIDKSRYNPSETVIVEAEAIKLIGDKKLHVNNVSINGSLRYSNKSIIQNFSCTTGASGKCTVSLTASSSYGNYLVEAGDFKAFSRFSVIPFSFNVYMKDELGKSLKNVYAVAEQGRVEVRVSNASDSDIYIFSGYIADSQGNVVKTISSTTLNSNNSFTNSFLFTVDAITFGYGAYTSYVTVTKSGDGSISSSASFQVKDWILTVNKKSTNSGFKYEYSAFTNQTLNLELYPTYRSNGSVIQNINSTSFAINLTDSLNNLITSANASWNASCGKEGCYEFSLTSPANTGQYSLYTTLSSNGDTQTESLVMHIINGVVSAQSTDKEGSIKELFGTNEYAFLTLASYNLTSSAFNLTNAEIFAVQYMNGSEFTYTQVSDFASVNMSNSVNEWAWNATSQMIKLDVPKAGGVYTVSIFGNNRSLGTTTRFIVNPYDFCASAKDSLANSGYYYVWQFKTTDTLYFEIKLTQASNPSGKASVSNFSSGNGTGMGAACNINTQTAQVVTNATLSVIEVKNLGSGTLQNVNTTSSTCQASDSSGGYTCTVKPLSKWEGGENVVKFNIRGQDGTSSIAFSRFEARAFYLYGWSSTWQNSPSSNITLSLQMYEAGSGWWSTSGSSGGLSGTVTLKKIEYQGRDGEWLWPPVDSGYNVSLVNSTSVTGSTGSMTIPVSNALNGTWRTGYYRAVFQATTSSGDTDYGYAWFGVKLWDVYGQPIECTSSGCNYKSYFNSKENISLYIKISKAGNYNYNDAGGQDIWGNTSIGIKSIQNCRTWPCKILNATQFTASTIYVNASSPWYWGANLNNNSNYIVKINTTSSNPSWGTGYYNVVLDINGTDTGYAWFNTIAFYVETSPTDINGTLYKYSIRGSQAMYFNTTATKSYKWQNSNYARYNESDFLNVTLDSVVLRIWDQTTYKSREFKYPTDINVTPNNFSGNGLVKMVYANGTWPTGYYWGEITLKNLDNETSTGWLWFNVQPFRVQINTNSYTVDSDQCLNGTLYIYDSDWYSSTPLAGNYSIIGVTENVWSNSGNSVINYTNYSTSSFNATGNMTLCPNSGNWGTGSWGGYHYLNVLVKDNVQNDSQIGWVSFRTVPFQVSWGSVSGSKMTNQLVNATVSITKPSTGANTSGVLTKIYQWRYDNYKSTKEEYIFSVGSCYSNVSSSCTINGSGTVIVYPPSGGWRVGYNYLYAEWATTTGTVVEDWGGIWFEGKEAYNGYFENSDSTGNSYKYQFNTTENITIRLRVRDSNYNAVAATITSVQYASPSSTCYSEYCRTYTSATYSPASVSGTGSVVLNIQAPSGGWTKGYYYLKAGVSGAGGTATITGGSVMVKDFTAPNVSISVPVINSTYSGTISFSATTTENTQCWFTIINFDNFVNWYCYGWNATVNSSNGSAPPADKTAACNQSKYGLSGASYYYEYFSNNYHYKYDGTNSYWDSVGISTGGRTHTATISLSNFLTQDYGISIGCYDEDYNSANGYVAFRASNGTSSLNYSQITIVSPTNSTYNSSTVNFNITTNRNSTCWMNLTGALYNLSSSNNLSFNYTNTTMTNRGHSIIYSCNNSEGNVNSTAIRYFTVNNSLSASFISPLNTTYTNANVTINISSSRASSVWWYNGTANLTYTSALNVTLANGQYTFRAYANNSEGNLNSSSVTFNVST